MFGKGALNASPRVGRLHPDRFLPERFARLPAGSYFPFGTGPRMCIVSAMATLEIQAALAAFVQRFRFAVPASAAPPRPIGQLSLRSEGGMPLVLSDLLPKPGASERPVGRI